MIFHGSQTYIEGAYLHPRVTLKDYGDPNKPVVFATPDLRTAELFTLKSKGMTHAMQYSDDYSVVLYNASLDELLQIQQGYVYELEKECFVELIIDGQHSGKWVSYDPVPIDQSNVHVINGFAEMIEKGLHVFTFNPVPFQQHYENVGTFSDILRSISGSERKVRALIDKLLGDDVLEFMNPRLVEHSDSSVGYG